MKPKVLPLARGERLELVRDALLCLRQNVKVLLKRVNESTLVGKFLEVSNVCTSEEKGTQVAVRVESRFPEST